MENKANRLIHTTSPYLLQHAYNPVDWYPWGEEALTKAKEEDKPIIVSIGYSACHWCHVMERESFENEALATLMNQHFVCIKVDREERPDVDAIYMDAIQAMGMQGGWPLNAFLTPDAKPFYAGTYFPPQNWENVLLKLASIFKEDREKLEESATQLSDRVALSELEKYGLTRIEDNFELSDLDEMLEKISPGFDEEWGGMQKAPKFPMPSVYGFLLLAGHTPKESIPKSKALAQVQRTLDKMAQGGIYDQIGGGFARYSVDTEWFAPHFEKMLYDNGQLVSLYAEVYNATKNSLYRRVVTETITWVERELMSEEGGFYAALDADSEGVEGKFYVWTEKEIEEVIQEEDGLALLKAYYYITPEGNWEHGNNILYRRSTDEEFIQKHHLTKELLENYRTNWQTKLFQKREERIRPGLDDKILTSWNALMLKGLVDAYRVFNESSFLSMALKNALFLREKVTKGSRLFHSYKDGKASHVGYLEDYALLIEAYLGLYQVTFSLEWLQEAGKLTEYTLENFYDSEEAMFYFTDQHGETLIARKKELFDNVIPASNSVMAKNLYFLSILLDKPEYREISLKMLGKVKPVLLQSVEYLANWGQLYALVAQPIREVVIVGENCEKFRQALEKEYYPHKVVVGGKEENTVPDLLQHRKILNGKTTVYVCYQKACQLPVHTPEEAWQQIKN